MIEEENLNKREEKAGAKQRKPRFHSFGSTGFLLKIYEILSKEDHKDIICWNEEGDTFLIINQSRLCQEVLPRYFKHNNFSSFVRQLNMYDFHKSKRKDDVHHAFKHEMFQRDKRHLLRFIKRKSNHSHPFRVQKELEMK